MAENPSGRVLRDVTLVEIVLDPRYDPPWPGAGIISVREISPQDPPSGDT